MSRQMRAYLPGVAFHLTARTNGHEEWFVEPIRDDIVAIIASALRRTDARLIVYSVMPSHVHIVVRQGDAPLARLMQSVCRRIAMLVQRKHEREGHIFERRFGAKPIPDAQYLRQVIYYTHNNPVEAKLCADGASYAWSSHARFICSSPAFTPPPSMIPLLIPTLELFAVEENSSIEDQFEGYRRFKRWREECDKLPEGVKRPPGPSYAAGDRYFAQRFRPAPPAPERFIPDLRDLVLDTLRELDPDLALETLLQRRGDRRLSWIRRTIIARAVAAGHRNVAIARFLNVAECTVSRVADHVYTAQSVAPGRLGD